MIQFAKDPPVNRFKSDQTIVHWRQWNEGLETWARKRPELTLAVAAALGATFACLVKRRT